LKRVLIIGADFSPSSLPPATRIRFFATHLPQFGWEPIVLTTNHEYYESAIDPENEQLLPDWLEVVRTRALPASLMRKVGIGDVGMRSLLHHWHALSQLHKKQRFDLIFIPVPPSVPMVLGRLAYLRFGIPYVVDYIDPWVSEYYWKLPREKRPPKWALSYALSRCLEPFSLRRAKHITGVSRGTTDQVVNRYGWLTAADATEIPYGAEDNDFEYLRQHPRQNKIFDDKDGKLHVCYIGAYVESMERTLRALFAAFRQGLERSPRVFEKMVLHFVGTTYSTNDSDPFRVTAIARDCGADAWIREHPQRVPYLDSLQIMLDAHALILLGSLEPHYTASKVFPYVLAQRPLLAVFHEESSVIAILTEVNAGRAVSFNEENLNQLVNKISVHLEEMVLGNYVPQIRWEVFEPYKTRALAGRLAQTFDAAIRS
jgi:glycosyltransferase involved in cell wall biosynthesis